MPQFAGRPRSFDSGGLDGVPEFAADVGGVEFAPVSGGEHQTGGAAVCPLELAEGGGSEARQAQGAPRPGGLGMAVGADRPPDGDAGLPRGSGEWVTQVDVLPREGAGFLGADAGAEAERDVSADPRPVARFE
jgi:hypothetical protein